jgi:hypothetical protein
VAFQPQDSDRRADTTGPPHYYSDTTDNTLYWYFTVLSWIPLYLIVYVGPRFL